jgi:cytochrome c biogenesis protein
LNKQKRTFINAIWDFFCSLKLTIVILILLAATSIIGTIIQQNRQPEEYIRIYGEATFRLFEKLHFFDMYHSWWFLALLTLFAINLVACSTKRLPRVFKVVKNPNLTPDESFYRSLSTLEEVATHEKPETVRDKIAAFLKKEFAEPKITEKDGKIHLYSEKMAWARFGVYITHASILIIFIGAIIGNIFGFKAFVNIVEGTETSRVWKRGGTEPQPIDLGFTVRCEDFSMTYYEGSMRPKEYKSLITVIDNGEKVITDRPVIVNDPLTYKGIVFYQSSYGPAGNPRFTIEATERASGEKQTYTLEQGKSARLPGGATVRVTNFAENFQNFGPAARIEVTKAGQAPRSFTVLKNFPQFDEQRGGDYIFSLAGLEQRQYTGLQVAKDPGVWVVWIGCTLLVVGSIVAFFLSHRRVWVSIKPLEDGRSGIMMGGNAHRNQAAFEMAFDDMKENLKKEING